VYLAIAFQRLEEGCEQRCMGEGLSRWAIESFPDLYPFLEVGLSTNHAVLMLCRAMESHLFSPEELAMLTAYEVRQGNLMFLWGSGGNGLEWIDIAAH
jgi:hypothetical protein